MTTIPAHPLWRMRGARGIDDRIAATPFDPDQFLL
jgi:hypothetical protein